MALSWLMTYNSQQLKEKRCINERCAVRSFFQLMNVCNESIHEIDTEEGSQKLCSHKVPRPKRRRWMAVWMVMSKPRTHIVVCWDTVSMLHFLYISFTFPLHFLYISFTFPLLFLYIALQRSPEKYRCKTYAEIDPQDSKVQKDEKPGKAWRAMISTPHSPHLFILFMLCILFAGADLLIFWNRERKHIPDVHALPDWIAYIHIEVPRPPLDHGTWSSTQGNDSLVTVGSTHWELSITVVVVVLLLLIIIIRCSTMLHH